MVALTYYPHGCAEADPARSSCAIDVEGHRLGIVWRAGGRLLEEFKVSLLKLPLKFLLKFSSSFFKFHFKSSLKSFLLKLPFSSLFSSFLFQPLKLFFNTLQSFSLQFLERPRRFAYLQRLKL